MTPEQRRRLARLGAPAAFLLAFTIFVLIVRAGMQDDEAATTTPTTAPATTRAGPPTTTTQAPATTAATTAVDDDVYVIESGDTLETVAAEHGTTVDALVELNPGIDPRSLTIGQEIRVR